MTEASHHSRTPVPRRNVASQFLFRQPVVLRCLQIVSRNPVTILLCDPPLLALRLESAKCAKADMVQSLCFAFMSTRVIRHDIQFRRMHWDVADPHRLACQLSDPLSRTVGLSRRLQRDNHGRGAERLAGLRPRRVFIKNAEQRRIDNVWKLTGICGAATVQDAINVEKDYISPAHRDAEGSFSGGAPPSRRVGNTSRLATAEVA